MSAYEVGLLAVCIFGIGGALLVFYWYRPRPPVVVASVFGPTQADYERELHEKDLRIFELGQELARSHALAERYAGQLSDLMDRWLVQSLQLATVRHRLTVSDRRLRWNRARVRNLTPPRNNVIDFPSKRAGAA